MVQNVDLEKQDWKVQFETSIDYLTDFIEALSSLREEGQLIATEDALFSDIRDTSNVAMAKSMMKGSAFNSYKHRADDTHVVGVNFENFEEFLKNTSSTSNVIITYPVEQGGAHHMHIDIIEEDLQLNLPLIDKNSVPEAPRSDPITSETRIKIDGTEIKKAIQHCKKVETEQNKSVTFKTDGTTFSISSSDKVNGSVVKEFAASGPSEEDMGTKETEIGLGYLDDVKNVISGSDEVTVHLDQEYPIRLDCNIDDEGDAKIIYVIAPRVSNE